MGVVMGEYVLTLNHMSVKMVRQYRARTAAVGRNNTRASVITVPGAETDRQMDR